MWANWSYNDECGIKISLDKVMDLRMKGTDIPCNEWNLWRVIVFWFIGLQWIMLTCMFRFIQGGVMTVCIYTIKGSILAWCVHPYTLPELAA